MAHEGRKRGRDEVGMGLAVTKTVFLCNYVWFDLIACHNLFARLGGGVVSICQYIVFFSFSAATYEEAVTPRARFSISGERRTRTYEKNAAGHVVPCNARVPCGLRRASLRVGRPLI